MIKSLRIDTDSYVSGKWNKMSLVSVFSLFIFSLKAGTYLITQDRPNDYSISLTVISKITLI